MCNETGLELSSISDSDNATSVLFDVFSPTNHTKTFLDAAFIVILFARPPHLMQHKKGFFYFDSTFWP